MISIVIPIFNEEASIPELLEQLRLHQASWNEDAEFLFIDDGSTDRSVELLERLAQKTETIRVVQLSRNFGHQAAVTAGLGYARGDAVVVMDGDLQDPPDVIARFLEKWREGYDVVYAIRTNRKESLLKKTAYKVFYRILAAVSNIRIPLDSGDFCVMDRKVVDVLNRDIPEHIRFVRGLRAYSGFQQIGVSYDRPQRLKGETKYTFGKLLKLAVDGIFGFSMFPLRLAAYLGLAFSIPSFLLGMFFILHRLLRFPVFGHYAEETPGLASLAVGMFFLGGVLLVILGILGEYIGRIYIEVKRRPAYIVKNEREMNKDG